MLTTMAANIATACLSALAHSNLVIYHRISSKFHIWLIVIKLLPKVEYGFCLMNAKHDSRQNGRRLLVCFCGHSTKSFITRFLSNFMYALLLSNFHRSLNMGFCPMTINKMAAKMATLCWLFLCTLLT